MTQIMTATVSGTYPVSPATFASVRNRGPGRLEGHAGHTVTFRSSCSGLVPGNFSCPVKPTDNAMCRELQRHLRLDWFLDLDDAREKVEGSVTVVLDPSTSAPSRGRQEAGDCQL